MTRNPITVPPDHTLEETAHILLKNRISGVPLADEHGRVVGTIFQREIFQALLSLSGFEKRGIQFALQVEDRPGSIKEVTDVVRNYGGRLVSILTSYERAPAGYRHLYIRAYDVDRSALPMLEADLRARATLLYMVDHKENERQEYVTSGIRL